MTLLEVRQLSKYWGGLATLSDVNFKMGSGELVGLIGPNGAGKTTLFNVVSGFWSPSKGAVIFSGENIAGMMPEKVAKRGISRVFQQNSLFMNETVHENVVSAHYLQRKAGFWRAVLNTGFVSKENAIISQNSQKLIELVGLDYFSKELAGNLPHGHQRFLAIAVALATNPRLLLLDEPATGMNQEESKTMMKLIKRIVEKGTTVLLVEHDMKLMLNLVPRIIVLSYGNKIADGTPDEICRNKVVVEAYLGDWKAT